MALGKGEGATRKGRRTSSRLRKEAVPQLYQTEELKVKEGVKWIQKNPQLKISEVANALGVHYHRLRFRFSGMR